MGNHKWKSEFGFSEMRFRGQLTKKNDKLRRKNKDGNQIWVLEL